MHFLERFNQREQMALLVLGVVVPIYLLYVLAWSPLQDSREQLQLQNRAEAEKLQRVETMVSQYLQLQASGQSGKQRRNLTTLINSSTAARGLSVARLQPNSRGEIQVRFENAGFDDLMSWLHRMEHGEGLRIGEVSVTPAGNAGRVNATVRLGQD
jgi:type II secretory pathway component PulM